VITITFSRRSNKRDTRLGLPPVPIACLSNRDTFLNLALPSIPFDSASMFVSRRYDTTTIKIATKAAVAGLTRGLARDLAPKGVTVNNIQPGSIDTDMNPAEGPYAPVVKGIISLGRYGKASEIASMVAYLASPEASFITGATINVDGGGVI
jgi:enoyl-[acyl-carrier-protein] reductase (NADH)